MTKGFLLIDQKKNTVIIPFDDEELNGLFKYRPDRPRLLDSAHTHETMKELDADVRAYLKGEYDG